MTTTESPVDNGVNVEALLGVRDALPDAPEIARFQWRSTTSWVNGTHSSSEVETFYGFEEGSGTGRRRPSPSGSTCGCRGPTGAATSCGGWTPRACSTSATTRFPILCERATWRRCSWSHPDRATLDLDALQREGVRLVGRLAGIRDGIALLAGSLPNVCALADLKLGRLLDSIDGWAARACIGGDSAASAVRADPGSRARCAVGGPAYGRDCLHRLGHRPPAGAILAACPGVRPQGPNRA